MKTIIVLLSTHDPGILNAVRGYKIAFLLPPVQYTIPKTINFSAQESDNVNAKISKFLEKGRIVHSSHAEGEFISNSFLRPKQDGPFHMIFKLKDINNLFVSITSKWIPSILMTLWDTYYSVPIAQEHQKYQKFIWHGNLYQFMCLAKGLSYAAVSLLNL